MLSGLRVIAPGRLKEVARCFLAASALLLSSTSALAKAIYFHKQAVGRAAFVADISECNELAGGVRTPQQYRPYSSNLATVAASSFFAGFFGAREKRSIIENVLRTCMADKGYRRVEAPPDLKRKLDQLDEHERLEQLFGLASSATPVGTLLPR
jgi:hypothetical protein